MNSSGESFDIVVVGAGPGGIAATVTAAEAGRSVCLIDDARFAGGQIWRNAGEIPASAEARHWLRRLDRIAPRITWLRQSRVVASLLNGNLLVESSLGPQQVRWGKLILATGARELFLPFPGWTSPGVFGAGGLQALVKQGLRISGKRIVVAGTGPLLLAVASFLRAKAAQVPLILEQAPAARINRFVLSLVRSPSKFFAAVRLRAQLLGTRCASDAYPLAVSRSASGLRVDFRRQNRDDAIECDYFACGFGLIPNSELPTLLACEVDANRCVRVDRRLQTSTRDVYAIGELTGIGGVEKAIVEGELAAFAAMSDEAHAARLEKARASTMHFVRRLEAAFALRPELMRLAKADTIVCRCEDVPLAAIASSRSGRDAKLQARCGMGACQGRICGPILQRLIGSEPPVVRPPVFPATVATLAEFGT
jgi:NADPH-dependent 2,4-dienoyl-CoA reductase/sulfur reductase-like enzyme